jgi:hypothetical protein
MRCESENEEEEISGKEMRDNTMEGVNIPPGSERGLGNDEESTRGWKEGEERRQG